MPPIITSADIDRPAAEVFAYATDPTRFREWQKGVVDGHMDGLTNGAHTAAVGARCVTTRRRGCIWPVSATTAKDRQRFYGQSSSSWIHVVEADWLERMQACRLYAYRLPTEAFRPHEVGGYWVADEPVDAIEQVVFDDLAGRQARDGIGLWITPSIWPFG